MTNHTNHNCPKCGAAIPRDAPSGLCPKCVLESVESTRRSSAAGRKKTPPPTIGQIAEHFPDLEIFSLLGVGGMGAVYKARQPQLERLVAIKILFADLAEDPAFVERFNREAKVLARLSHPNIVGIHDFGKAGPYCYLMMEYVDGVNLRQAMQTGGFSPSETLELVQENCTALKFAHEEGILHRDIKPENVLIDAKGRVKIADFGIAKLIGGIDSSDVTLTLQGSILGTPHYMAPEQIETPSDIDQRADIYSLGVVLYEMLTGELPLGRFALPSTKAQVDSRIDEIVLRALEKEREARFQTAEEVSTSVAGLANGPDLAPQKAAITARTEPAGARFSLASPLLSGMSLIFAFTSLVILGVMDPFGPYAHFPSGGSELAEAISSKLPAQIIFSISLLASALTGLTGFVLGCKALSDIRHSGGIKTGAGLAVFAVALWPLCLLLTITIIVPYLAANQVPVGSRTESSIVPLIIALAYFILQFAACFVSTRGLYLWAKGVENEKGKKHFPGFGIPILKAFGLVIFSFILLQIGNHMRHAGDTDEDVPGHLMQKPAHETIRSQDGTRKQDADTSEN